MSPAPGVLPEAPVGLNKQVKVALFCGGRGSASLIREFMRWNQVELSLIVNGYDDGLSTGHLRDLVPSMLGPSDFRKNLSRLIDLHSAEQYALQRLLEYRFSKDFSESDIRAFQDYVASPRSTSSLPAPLDELLGALHQDVRFLVLEDLRILFAFQREHLQVLDYGDCSFGNLVFAGAYIKSDSNFNASVDSLALSFRTAVRLVNVTQGENRILTALKADGSFLGRESEIVSKQNASPILDIFLLEHGVSADTRAELEDKTTEEKLALLEEIGCRRLDFAGG